MPDDDEVGRSRGGGDGIPLAEFEWDEEKNRKNVEKHGINFTQAVRVFSVPAAVSFQSSHKFGEQRYLMVGELDGVLITVVYTLRGDKIRIISTRRARRSERKRYGQ